MSRRQTPRVKRERSRERRAIERAIIRAVRELTWSIDRGTDRVTIDRESTMELIGLRIARNRV